MALTVTYKKYQLKFNFPAGTSRGVMHDRDTYLLKIEDPCKVGVFGLGESAPLPGLSMDHGPGFEKTLAHICEQIAGAELPESIAEIAPLLRPYIAADLPAILFGFEMALLDLMKGGQRILFAGPFTQGTQSLPINGLIWMGDKAFMKQQIKEKIKAGYSCLKMKVGAIDFEQEMELLTYLRQLAPEAILRIDANGAFTGENAGEKLHQLASLQIHSIEQPLGPGQRAEMARLCSASPIPIALDEELIGVHGIENKTALLEEIKPQYIVLKPTLLGGFQATREWLDLADSMGIGWWITSALESNIGLSAISQFTASLPNQGHQGLGTGQLYSNNIEAPLRIEGGHLYYEGGSWGEEV